MTLWVDVAWGMDPEPCRIEAARIPILDRSFLFGHGVFETILMCAHKKNETWEFESIGGQEHVERLVASARMACIDMTDCTPDLWLRVQRLCQFFVKENPSLGAVNAFKLSLRIVVSRGTGGTLLAPPSLVPKVYLLLRYVAGQPATGEADGGGSALHRQAIGSEKSFRLMSYPDERNKKLLPCKHPSYLWSIIGLEEAHEKGFDDILMYNEQGLITESSIANVIFFTRDTRVLVSPPDDGFSLPGLTKRRLKSALKNLSVTLVEEPVPLKSLGDFEGMALTSSVRGLVPVASVDNHVCYLKSEGNVDSVPQWLHTLHTIRSYTHPENSAGLR